MRRSRRRALTRSRSPSARSSSCSYSAPICASSRRVACASSSSTFESAKPTWIRTQSPGCAPRPSCSSLSRLTLTLRRTPTTSTFAIWPVRVDDLHHLTRDRQAHAYRFYRPVAPVAPGGGLIPAGDGKPDDYALPLRALSGVTSDVTASRSETQRARTGFSAAGPARRSATCRRTAICSTSIRTSRKSSNSRCASLRGLPRRLSYSTVDSGDIGLGDGCPPPARGPGRAGARRAARGGGPRRRPDRRRDSSAPATAAADPPAEEESWWPATVVARARPHPSRAARRCVRRARAGRGRRSRGRCCAVRAARARRSTSSAPSAAQPRLELRLTLLLWHLARPLGPGQPGGIRLTVPLTHQLLGRLVGAERPSVSHALSRLSHAGLVTGHGDEWLLHGTLDQLCVLCEPADGRVRQLVRTAAAGAGR